MDWLDYREKLGIGFYEQDKVKYFMIKIFNVLDTLEDMYQQISDSEYFRFCNVTGTTVEYSVYRDNYSSITKILHNHSQILEEFLAYYIAFINCQEDDESKQLTCENFKKLLCNCLNESHIGYEIFEDEKEYYIFPKGVEEFDDALVSEPLRWLVAYPEAEKAWSKALKKYSEEDEDNASEVADLYRKALETFFKNFFGGNKALENYKMEYGNYLKVQGIPKEIAGNFETLLQSYTNFINNYAKHRDATSNKVIEYLMYQTGNIIRLLILLKDGEIEN